MIAVLMAAGITSAASCTNTPSTIGLAQDLTIFSKQRRALMRPQRCSVSIFAFLRPVRNKCLRSLRLIAEKSAQEKIKRLDKGLRPKK